MRPHRDILQQNLRAAHHPPTLLRRRSHACRARRPGVRHPLCKQRRGNRSTGRGGAIRACQRKRRLTALRPCRSSEQRPSHRCLPQPRLAQSRPRRPRMQTLQRPPVEMAFHPTGDAGPQHRLSRVPVMPHSHGSGSRQHWTVNTCDRPRLPEYRRAHRALLQERNPDQRPHLLRLQRRPMRRRWAGPHLLLPPNTILMRECQRTVGPHRPAFLPETDRICFSPAPHHRARTRTDLRGLPGRLRHPHHRNGPLRLQQCPLAIHPRPRARCNRRTHRPLRLLAQLRICRRFPGHRSRHSNKGRLAGSRVSSHARALRLPVFRPRGEGGSP